MQGLSKLIVAFFLSVVFLLNTAVAYAIPQDIDSIDDDAAVGGAVILRHKTRPDGNYGYGSAGAVLLKHETDPDSWTIIIDPSLKGAAAGAAAGAVVGTVACTQTVVLAPAAPICGTVGALVGGATGLVFGSSSYERSWISASRFLSQE